jgi:hypothetical protein
MLISRRVSSGALLLVVLTTVGVRAQQAPRDSTVQAAEGVVNELYDLVTFPAGTTPDWDRVRSLFLDEAVIVLRTTRTATTVFTLEGFVGDFVNFIERANVEQTGFEEEIVNMKSMVFKDMAYVLVLYEAHITGSPRAPQQGIDLILLSKRDDGWKIAAITNDIPDAEHPVPAVLRN